MSWSIRGEGPYHGEVWWLEQVTPGERDAVYTHDRTKRKRFNELAMAKAFVDARGGDKSGLTIVASDDLAAPLACGNCGHSEDLHVPVKAARACIHCPCKQFQRPPYHRPTLTTLTGEDGPDLGEVRILLGRLSDGALVKLGNETGAMLTAIGEELTRRKGQS